MMTTKQLFPKTKKKVGAEKEEGETERVCNTLASGAYSHLRVQLTIAGSRATLLSERKGLRPFLSLFFFYLFLLMCVCVCVFFYVLVVMFFDSMSDGCVAVELKEKKRPEFSPQR